MVTKVRVRLAAFMGCNLGKGSQPDDSDLREDGKRLASGPTSPTTPPPGIVSDRMVDGHVPNKDTNALQQRLESTIEEQGQCRFVNSPAPSGSSFGVTGKHIRGSLT